MPVIDVHQHLWPEPLVEQLARRRDPPRLVGSTLEVPGEPAVEVDLDAHRLETRLALLDRCGIEVAVVSLPPTLGAGVLPDDEWDELAEAYERGILELARTDERIVPLAARSDTEGFAGVCVSALELLDVDAIAPRLDGLERSSFLFVHPGPSASRTGAPHWWSAVVEHTAQMQAAYAAWISGGTERWPEVPVIFAILAGGGPFQHERLRSRGFEVRPALLPNVYLETSSYGRRALELCMAAFGIRQLLYGSDAPVVDPGATLRDVRGFGQAVADALCRDNPTRLFG
jgi:hypothetical protein